MLTHILVAHHIKLWSPYPPSQSKGELQCWHQWILLQIASHRYLSIGGVMWMDARKKHTTPHNFTAQEIAIRQT